MQPISIDALHRCDGVRLRRFLTRLLGNPADAADAHQETYLLMLAALSRTQVEKPSAFLFQIANNVALRMRNRQRLEGRIFQPTSDADWAGMAQSIEIRVPFVDPVFLAALPPGEVLAALDAKAAVADVPVPGLPPSIRNRRKTGFDASLPAEGLLIWRVVSGRVILEESHGVEGPSGPRVCCRPTPAAAVMSLIEVTLKPRRPISAEAADRIFRRVRSPRSVLGWGLAAARTVIGSNMTIASYTCAYRPLMSINAALLTSREGTATFRSNMN